MMKTYFNTIFTYILLGFYSAIFQTIIYVCKSKFLFISYRDFLGMSIVVIIATAVVGMITGCCICIYRDEQAKASKGGKNHERIVPKTDTRILLLSIGLSILTLIYIFAIIANKWFYINAVTISVVILALSSAVFCIIHFRKRSSASE